jgi:hypothetical protein
MNGCSICSLPWLAPVWCSAFCMCQCCSSSNGVIHFGTPVPYQFGADCFESRVLTLHVPENPGAADEAVVGDGGSDRGPERAGHIMKSGDPVDAIATTAGAEGVDAAR